MNTLPKTIEWIGGLDGCVRLIDQTKLPGELVMLDCTDERAIWQAIKRLSVRGAPAIGIAGAMGVVLGVRDFPDKGQGFLTEVDRVCDYLATSRPTAVNLSWAIERMRRVAYSFKERDNAIRKTDASASDANTNDTKAMGAQSISTNSIKIALLAEAKRIRDEDAAMCRAIGLHGEALLRDNVGVLTHCNAGSLATAEFGTALAPLYVAHERGRRFQVFACETRPLLQGARLTTWELLHAGIDVTLLCDSAAGSLMRSGRVSLVMTGADCIAANGDVANKIGTYPLALLAHANNIPFYVAAPSSTFDLTKRTGAQIPIEQRDENEIRCGFGRATAPDGVACYNPAFDVTPAQLVRGLITEKGIIEPVEVGSIEKLLSGPAAALPKQ